MDLKPMLVEKQLKIQAYDIDVMGIVSNIVYIRWFEDMRFECLDRYWAYEDMLKIGQSPILSKTEVEYKRPLTIYDKPFAQLWISSMTKSRWTASIEIKSNDKLVCFGKQTGYCYDINKKRPIPIPQAFMQKYQAFLDEQPLP